METIAKSSITIVDLTDGRTLNLVLQTNLATTQVVDEGTGVASPDWTLPGTPMIITPQIYVSGETEDQVAYLKNPVWKINGSSSITGGSVSTANPYRLTISSNITGASQYKVDFEGVWVDPISGVENQVVASITLTKATNGGDSILAVAYAPLGTVFNEDVTTLSARCDMWRGAAIDNELVTYQWFIRTTADWKAIDSSNTEGITGVTTNQIAIPRTAVLNIAAFKCEITDTDPKSTTNGTTVADVVSFLDITDPYSIVIEGANQITTAVPTTALTPYLEKGGERMSDTVQNAAEWSWSSVDSKGAPRPTWRSSGVVNDRILTVGEYKDDVVGRATFIVSASLDI